MIENTVDFVLSKINLLGHGSKSVTVGSGIEIPKQAVTEAIVNAVAHRSIPANPL
jgi:predicted HTH transcriptional regulator